MEARIKRLFLRKKGKSVEQSLQKNQSSTEEATRTYNLKTSSYDFSDSSPAGRPPRTGSYPIKGKNNRKLSLRHHRHNASAEFSNPSTSDHLHLDGKAPPATSESFDNDRQSSEIIQPGSITGPSTHGGSRQRMPDPPQLEALSSLVLEDRERKHVNEVVSYTSILTFQSYQERSTIISLRSEHIFRLKLRQSCQSNQPKSETYG